MLALQAGGQEGERVPYKEVQDSENQFIAGGAAYADKFLGVIQQRCNASGIGITLGPTTRNRKDPRPVMRGNISFGRALTGKRDYMFEVYADPAGPNLQVGYQLMSEEVGGGILGNTDMVRRANARQVRMHNDPNTQRQLSGIIQGFYQMVFVPTVQDLVDAIGATKQQTGGFLGA
jgi:hypothetical protein